jgi:hypothetical protein
LYRVTLRFAQPPSTIGVWLDEVYLPDATLNGDELVIDLPRTSDQPAISLGVPTSLDSARFEVVLALTVRTVDSAPQLYPAKQP